MQASGTSVQATDSRRQSCLSETDLDFISSDLTSLEHGKEVKEQQTTINTAVDEADTTWLLHYPTAPSVHSSAESSMTELASNSSESLLAMMPYATLSMEGPAWFAPNEREQILGLIQATVAETQSVDRDGYDGPTQPYMIPPVVETSAPSWMLLPSNWPKNLPIPCAFVLCAATLLIV